MNVEVSAQTSQNEAKGLSKEPRLSQALPVIIAGTAIIMTFVDTHFFGRYTPEFRTLAALAGLFTLYKLSRCTANL